MFKENEIRISENTFLCEVALDEDGEVVVGRTEKGEFRAMPLITFFTRAEKIGNRLKIDAATRRGASRKQDMGNPQ